MSWIHVFLTSKWGHQQQGLLFIEYNLQVTDNYNLHENPIFDFLTIIVWRLQQLKSRESDTTWFVEGDIYDTFLYK